MIPLICPMEKPHRPVSNCDLRVYQIGNESIPIAGIESRPDKVRKAISCHKWTTNPFFSRKHAFSPLRGKTPCCCARTRRKKETGSPGCFPEEPVVHSLLQTAKLGGLSFQLRASAYFTCNLARVPITAWASASSLRVLSPRSLFRHLLCSTRSAHPWR